MEPVGGGGGGTLPLTALHHGEGRGRGTLPLTALHHGEGRGRGTLPLTALGATGALPVDFIPPVTPVTPVRPLTALMLTFDLTQTEVTQYVFHCVLHVCSLKLLLCVCVCMRRYGALCTEDGENWREVWSREFILVSGTSLECHSSTSLCHANALLLERLPSQWCALRCLVHAVVRPQWC